MTILLPVLAVLFTVLATEGATHLPFVRSRAQRVVVYVVGIVVGTTIMSLVVSSLIVVLKQEHLNEILRRSIVSGRPALSVPFGPRPLTEGERRSIVSGTVIEIISATAAVLAARWGAVAAVAATTSKGSSAKISLSLYATMLFLAAFAAAFLAFLGFGVTSW